MMPIYMEVLACKTGTACLSKIMSY